MSRPEWFFDFEKTIPSLTGKRIAITGTTSGIGYISALACGKRGAELFLLNRVSERSTKSVQNLRRECPTGTFHEIACDLQDFKSVREAAAELKTLCKEGLDILVNNAGIMAHDDRATKDGFDVQMQTNHLSHFLLVKEMMPVLRVAAAAQREVRIVNHTSGWRFGVPLDENYFQKKGGNLGGDGSTPNFERYHQSKLSNLVFTYALADRLKANGDSGIKVLCASPGVADTTLTTNMNPDSRLLCCMPCVVWCMFGRTQTAEDGTMPLLSCIAKPDLESADLITPTIGYKNETYGPTKIQKRSEPPTKDNVVCQDKGAQDMLWKASEAAIGETFVL